MGYGETNIQQAADNIVGVPTSTAHRGARDFYEYGSVTGASRSGRYKAFATAFVQRPAVVFGPMRSSGTVFPVLVGTPNLGSFQVRLANAPVGGSTSLFYIAMGAKSL